MRTASKCFNTEKLSKKAAHLKKRGTLERSGTLERHSTLGKRDTFFNIFLSEIDFLRSNVLHLDKIVKVM